MFSFINLGLGTFLLWGIFSFFFDSADHEYFSFFEKCSFLMVRLLLCVCVCVCCFEVGNICFVFKRAFWVKVAQSCPTLCNPMEYSPWNSPDQNTGVGSLSLLQGIFLTQGSNPGIPHCRQILYQLNHKGHPRILEWVAYPFSSGSSWPRNQMGISCIPGGFFTNWAMREALTLGQQMKKKQQYQNMGTLQGYQNFKSSQ